MSKSEYFRGISEWINWGHQLAGKSNAKLVCDQRRMARFHGSRMVLVHGWCVTGCVDNYSGRLCWDSDGHAYLECGHAPGRRAPRFDVPLFDVQSALIAMGRL